MKTETRATRCALGAFTVLLLAFGASPQEREASSDGSETPPRETVGQGTHRPPSQASTERVSRIPAVRVRLDDMAERQRALPPPPPRFFPDPIAPGPIEVRGGPISSRRLKIPSPSSRYAPGQPRHPGSTLTPPQLQHSFPGMSDNNTYIPPDTQGAAGPSHLVSALNSGFAIFDKNTGALVFGPISLQAFWAALGTGAGQPASTPFDPKVIYDQASQRFIVISAGGPFNTSSWMLLAVSVGPDPTQGFDMYAIDADASTPGYWADYPGVGVDARAVYMTANMFSLGGSFGVSKFWVADMPSLLAGGPMVVTEFFDPTGGFTWQPAQTFGPSAANYLVSEGWSGGGTTRLIRILQFAFPSGAPVLSDLGFVQVSDYGFDGLSEAPQGGCGSTVAVNDRRLMNAVQRGGTIWTTHHVDDGVSDGVGRTEVAWYGIDPAAARSSAPYGVPAHEGRVSTPGRWYFFPSIAVNANNDVALGFSGSDTSTYASAYVALHKASDPDDAQAEIVLLKAGESSYDKRYGGFANRWGDYSATGVDPSDDRTFWSLQEYARPQIAPGCPSANTGVWGTWWGSFRADCLKDADCDDAQSCTDDSCDTGTGSCLHAANDANACTDQNACTSDACVSGICVSTPAIACDDGNLCTSDACDPATGQCVFRTTNCRAPGTLFADDMESGAPGWTHELVSDTSGQTFDNWHLSGARASSGAASWHSGPSSPAQGDTRLISPSIDLTGIAAGDPVTLTFKHFYHFDDCGDPSFTPDGAIIEVSAEGGPFVQVPVAGGYPYVLQQICGPNPLEGRPAFAHNSGGVFRTDSVDLSSFAGEHVRIGFHVGWDCGNCNIEEGWYVDDVKVEGSVGGGPCRGDGICDPGTGACTFPPLPDGSPCDDDNLCSQTDTCQGGACVGSSPPVCTGLTAREGYVADLGGSSDHLPDYLLGERITVHQPFSLTHLGLIARLGGAHVTMALYTDDLGNPGHLVARTASTLMKAGVMEIPILSPAAVIAADYWVMAVFDNETSVGQASVQPTQVKYIPFAYGTEIPTDFPAPATYTGQAFNYHITGKADGTDPCRLAGVCDPATGLCSDPPAPDGTACDDGNACTGPDTCRAGFCGAAAPTVCDDGNPCTADTCDPVTGACVFKNDDAATCADGNLCTKDTCVAGVCVSTYSCDDGNACTDDQCVASPVLYREDFESGGAGWSHEGLGGTDTWHLASSSCFGNALPSTMYVSNGNAGPSCFANSSRERSRLVSPPITLPAQAGMTLAFDALSFDEAGRCLASRSYDAHDVLISTDGGGTATRLNDCFALADGSGQPNHRLFDISAFAGQTIQIQFVYDTLDASEGHTFAVDNVTIAATQDLCEHTPVTDGTACDDRSACTQSDACRSGRCEGIPSVSCDDGNPCTDDACDPETGRCLHANDDTNPCDDGNPCTLSDVCSHGSCVGSNPLDCSAACPPGFTPGGGGCQRSYDIDESLLDNLQAVCDGVGINHYNGCGGQPYGFHWVDTGIGVGPVRRVDLALETGVNCGGSTSSFTLNGVPAGSFALLGSCDCASNHGTVSLPQLGTAPYVQGGFNVISIQPSGDCEGLSRSDTLGGRFARVVVTYANPLTCLGPGTCDPSTGSCRYPSLPDGTPCDDGSACTRADACVSGSCVGGDPVSCSATSPCRIATCDPATGQCLETPAPDGSPCDDGNACTSPDACLAGTCVGAPSTACDDGNPCTDDACDPATGQCSHTADDANPCSDGNGCTSDACVAGQCVSTDACDDHNVCTTDRCVVGTPVLFRDDFETGGAGWAHASLGAADTWHVASSACFGIALPSAMFVSNGNAGPSCIDSSSWERSRLVSPPIALPSVSGIVLDFDALSFDESGPCLASGQYDSHDVGISTNGGASYTLLNDCFDLADGAGHVIHHTFDISAYAGQTIRVVFVYDTLDPVVGHTFAIDNVAVTATGDLCQHTPVADGAACNDGNACTQGDACREGVCEGTPAVFCDDGNPCTDDACDPATGQCAYTNDDTNACSDGNPCTQTDVCYGGSCLGTNPLDCSSTCPPGYTPGGGGCQRSYDIDESLLDNQDGSCDGFGVDRYNLCNGQAYGFHWNDLGVGVGPVSRIDLVVETGLTCGGTASSFTLNGTPSGSLQLLGSCSCTSAHGAASVPSLGVAPYVQGGLNAISILPSSDCEGLSRSQALGGHFARVVVTYGAGLTCQGPGTCDPATGTCRYPILPDGTPCDDGSACTQIDACSGGVCLGSDPVICSASAPCHVATCDPATGGCLETPAPDATPCDDGSACTAPDACLSGVCVGTPSVSCDDANPCTDDRCNPANGQCTHTPDDANTCSDGSLCTTDACVNGSCVSTYACNDGNVCTADRCAPSYDLLHETFSTGAAGWSHMSYGGADTWHAATSTCHGQALPSAMYVSNGNAGSACVANSSYERSILVSPPITLPTEAAASLSFDALSFDEAGRCLASGDYDSHDVGISTNSGATYVRLNACTALADGSGGTTHSSFDLAAFAGQTVQIVFVYDTLDARAGHTFAVDNVFVTVHEPACENAPVADGTSCDDGSACTQADACRAGHCEGVPSVSCDDGNPCTDDACNPATGQCSHTNDDANACSDGNPCTRTDVCSGGSCVGSNPVDCSSDCPAGFTPVPGGCQRSYDIDSDLLDNQDAFCDTTAANRYNGCDGQPYGFHWTDLGAALWTVSRVDLTLETGISCGGVVSNFSLNGVPSGSFVPVGNCNCLPPHATISRPQIGTGPYVKGGLNVVSIAASVTCEGLSRSAAISGRFARVVVTYQTRTACQGPGSCDPSTGACRHDNLPDGTPCDDGDACTTGDTCTGGACTGAPSPGEVDDGVRLARTNAVATISWNPAPSSSSSDILRGLVRGLPVGPGGGDEVCFGTGIVGSSSTDAAVPDPGDAFWYLIRGVSSCGRGTYGYEVLAGTRIVRSSTSCP